MRINTHNIASFTGEQNRVLQRATLSDITKYGRLFGASGFFGAEDGGYHTSGDAQRPVVGTTVTVDGQPIDEIWNEINRRTALFNQHAQALVGLMSFRLDRAQEKVSVYDTAAFEEATEFGRPGKVRVRQISRGFPLKHYDLGYGYTREFIDSARASQLLAVQNKVESAYWALELDIAMSALFNNANATDEDGISVKRLYNADGEIPPQYKRVTHDGTHTHYLTTGNSSPTLANIQTLEGHLLHHGYGDNGEQLVLLANRTDMLNIRGLAEFIEAESSQVPIVRDGQIVGLTSNAPEGLSPEGYIGKFVVVQEDMVPVGYLVAFATGGLLADENPLGIREHENASIRGLRLVEGPNGRYPLIDAVYDSYLGAGVRHRGGAAIMQVTAGAYTVPTFPV